jgi:hypothetical protein
MAIASNRSIAVSMSGDIVFTRTDSSAENAAAPGVVEKKDLSTGANTITVPSGSKGVVIKPPTGNTQALTLKGVSGDTGILIAKVDPTSLGLDTGVANFVLNAAGTVTGVVFVWT